MKQIVPDYYGDFRCIGGKCPHNCCIGWEIDIDDDALTRYRTVPGELGDQLRRDIVADDCPHFRLSDDRRCPFLNHDNLCRIILALGEDALCQICRDHPRFYNEWTDRTEAGVGLCCPAAAQLILNRSDPVRLIAIADDGAEEPAPDAPLRDRLLAAMQNRTQPMEKRFAAILATVGYAPDERSDREWAAFYRGLERMDPAWDSVLERLENGSLPPPPQDAGFTTAREQLAVYLLYRHLFGAREDGRIAERAALCVYVDHLLSRLAQNTEQLMNLARLYSAEVEYSEENLNAVLEAMAPK